MSSSVAVLHDRPVYGFGQVDHILGLSSGTAHRWIDGYTRAGRSYPPIVRIQQTGEELVTWGEFIETRLIAQYRDQGAPVALMRPAIELLRERLGTLYPLASAGTWLEVEGKELVQKVQEQVGLEKRLSLVVVRSGQEMLDWAPRAREFMQSLHWDDDVITRLTPSIGDPDVLVDPLRSFGEPSVRGVRTEIIRELYVGGDSIEMIAELYELEEAVVESAVRYELRARSSSTQNAA